MATIVLQAAGGALGGLVGGPLGAVAGRALGALGGSSLDARLFGSARRTRGPRAQSRVLDADEGGGIARLYGTARIAGQIIWATRLEETANTERSGSKGGRGSQSAEHTSYSYFGSFAVGLCEGPIAGVRRIWADGEELDRTRTPLRIHLGTQAQDADPLIEAKQGRGNAPAYRGLAYLVFDRLALERWGNRIPQISAEVIRPVGALERDLCAVCIIPGASEHGLDPAPVRERVGAGEDRLVNRHVLHADTDWNASIDELTALCPRLERAALVTAWFADDLRAGHARVAPGVEIARRDETTTWECAGQRRGEARPVSRIDGAPAYGGTPSDAGVVRAIRDLRRRGLAVTLYPFLLLDVPPGNGRADPYGAREQAPFPWRGRMTLDPAGPGDRTAGARAEIERFVGTARAADFQIEADAVRYRGPAEWTLRRMVLHHAWLARLAGGVDAFVIASEMRGLTRLRDERERFPFVEALIALARDVRSVLPHARITYAADWSEYFGYHPADGSGDVFFNLDPLWADPAIDMVGIDNYLPLADLRGDERDGTFPEGFASPYDRRGLAAGIAAGEYGEWFYASEADRREGRRTPITDGLGKSWTFRAKDIRSWWGERHVERRGGREVGEPTAWVPGMKPIWMTELGCPAIDRGANQPNVFVDAKSAESAVPHFSGGGRDDAMQRRFLEAHLRHWDPSVPGFRDANNPVSPVYGARMVDAGATHLWCWDARPFPAFPHRADVWRDGSNWERGHWLTGRLGQAPLDALLAEHLASHGIGNADVSGVDGDIGGFVLSDPGTARDDLEDLLRLCGIEAWSEGGRLRLRSGNRLLPERRLDAVVDTDDAPLIEVRRAAAGDLPGEVLVGFADPLRVYQPSVESAVACGMSARQATADLPVVLAPSQARTLAQDWIARVRGERETASFALAPGELGVAPGDLVRWSGDGDPWQVERIEDGPTRRVVARRRGPGAGRRGERDETPGASLSSSPAFASRPVLHLLDLPQLAGHPDGTGARVAVCAKPWLPYALLSSPTGTGFEARMRLARRATLGTLASDLAPGPEGRVDRGAVLDVDLAGGALAGISEAALLAGGNVAAVRGAGGWEVLAFRDAEEIAPGRFRLRHLLRALGGTEDAGATPAGSAFVLLDAAVEPVALSPADAEAQTEWLCVPAGAGLDDDAALRVTKRMGYRAALPLSPVHLRGALDRTGGLALRWIRRSRLPAEAWEGEPALGEETERYRVSVGVPGQGAVIVRDTGEPLLELPPSEIRAAFGPLAPAEVEVEVAQVSQTAGPGIARRIRIRRM